jgi:hypothetical protein
LLLFLLWFGGIPLPCYGADSRDGKHVARIWQDALSRL